MPHRSRLVYMLRNLCEHPTMRSSVYLVIVLVVISLLARVHAAPCRVCPGLEINNKERAGFQCHAQTPENTIIGDSNLYHAGVHSLQECLLQNGKWTPYSCLDLHQRMLSVPMNSSSCHDGVKFWNHMAQAEHECCKKASASTTNTAQSVVYLAESHRHDDPYYWGYDYYHDVFWWEWIVFLFLFCAVLVACCIAVDCSEPGGTRRWR